MSGMPGENESAQAAVSDSSQSAPADAAPSPSQPSPSPVSSQPDTGDTGQSKQTLLDAVLKVAPASNEKDVLETAAEPPPEGEKPEKPDDQAEPAETPDEGEDPVPQEATPALRKKFNKLLKQRRELRQEVEALRPSADIGRELENFASVTNLGGDEIANVLRMSAMLKAGDYQGFYAAVSPFVRTAQEYLGIVLPKDLQVRVQQGQMTEAAAREFARQRFDGQRADIGRREAERTVVQHRTQAAQSDVHRAVAGFESRLSANDPDYKAKAPAVRRAAQAMVYERGGTINSVEEALEITKAAYEEVNRQVRAYQPRPVATAPKPNGSTQSPSTRSAPKSLMEAALQGLEVSRRGG
jgi:hypothetical protein